jgi:hypothetical protein
LVDVIGREKTAEDYAGITAASHRRILREFLLQTGDEIGNTLAV